MAKSPSRPMLMEAVPGALAAVTLFCCGLTLLMFGKASEACRLALSNAACDLIFGRDRQHVEVSVMGRNAQVYQPRMPMLLQARSRRAAIFVLHGSFASPQDMFSIGFEEFADLHDFLVVYPEMQIPSSASWGYRADIPFFRSLIQFLINNFQLDSSRVFVCGHSAGGTMSLFLQNEVDLFDAAGAVEAGVGHLDDWSLDRHGHRTMVFWNQADPVLKEYGGEELYNQTISTLRRRSSAKPTSKKGLETSSSVVFAELRNYTAASGDPELVELNWRSEPGTHSWPKSPEMTLDGARQLVGFFLNGVAPGQSMPYR